MHFSHDALIPLLPPVCYCTRRDESFCLLVNIGHLHPVLMSHDDRHNVQQPPMQQRLEAFGRQRLYLSYSWFWVYLRSTWLCDLQRLIWTSAGSKDTIQW